jgi:hypothetical protein
MFPNPQDALTLPLRRALALASTAIVPVKGTNLT